jgi:competence protein ComEC
MEWQGLRISVLYPPAEERSPGRGSNDRSMVLMVDQGGYRTLLTGDVEAASERNLLDRGADLRADLLKVPHHGSKSSTTSRFLERVSPRDAVITSGWKNRFGHPSADVVARLLGRGVRIWRGDFCGEFVTQVSGDEIRSGPVHPCRNPLQ